MNKEKGNYDELEKMLLQKELDLMKGKYFADIDKIWYQHEEDAKSKLVNIHESIHKYLFDSTLGFLLTDFQQYLEMLISLFEWLRVKYMQEYFGKKDYYNDKKIMEYLMSEKILKINKFLSSKQDMIKLIQYILKINKRKEALSSSSKYLNEGVACYLSLNLPISELQLESEKQKEKLEMEHSIHSLGYKCAKIIAEKYGTDFLVFSAEVAMNVPYYNFDLFNCSDEEFEYYIDSIYNCDLRWLKFLQDEKIYELNDNISIIKYINNIDLPKIEVYNDSSIFFQKYVLQGNMFKNLLKELNREDITETFTSKNYKRTLDLKCPEEYQEMFLKRNKEFSKDILTIEDYKKIKDQRCIIRTMEKIIEMMKIRKELRTMENIILTINGNKEVLDLFKEVFKSCGLYNLDILSEESSYDFEFSDIKTIILAIINVENFKLIFSFLQNKEPKYDISITSESDGQNIKIDAKNIKKDDMLNLIEELKQNNIIH